MADDLKAWIGRREVVVDTADPGPFERLADLLDKPSTPKPLQYAPLLGHWLTFLPRTPQSELGQDGHPRRGGFLPPVALPRRMWAGSRLTFFNPIPLGSSLERRSLIKSVEPKSGRSGEMVFVTVNHEIFANGALSVTEDQDIVYREAPKAEPSAPPKSADAPNQGQWTRLVNPNPVLLFRYSALTYNAHRIHYDQPYCRVVEGYPDLVVHGPLIATLLLDHFQRQHPDASVQTFTFRAQRPLYNGAPFWLNGARTDAETTLWASADGQAAMTATVTAL